MNNVIWRAECGFVPILLAKFLTVWFWEETAEWFFKLVNFVVILILSGKVVEKQQTLA